MINYKRLAESIKSELMIYRSSIDSFERNYKDRLAKVDDRCREMTDQWTTDYLRRYKEEQRLGILSSVKADMDKTRNSIGGRVNEYLGQLEKGLSRYFSAPVNPELAAKLQIIAVSGLTGNLSKTEKDMLRKEARSFTECRAVEKITAESGNNPQSPIIKSKYDGVSDDVMTAFTQFKNSAQWTLAYYVGTGTDLLDTLDSPSPTALALGTSFFRSNAEETFVKTLDEELAGLPKDTVLTSDERKMLSRLLPIEEFGQRYYSAKDKLENLMKDENMKDIIIASGDYDAWLPKEEKAS